jgi:hypothetical protein
VSGFINWSMTKAPTLLLTLAIINVAAGLVTTLGQPINALAVIAASLGAGLIPFIAAAVLYRIDQHLKNVNQANKGDSNA